MSEPASGDAVDVARTQTPRRVAGGAAAVALAVVLWGGCSHRWPWTGINGGTATLWDWLHLLFLPLLVPTVIVPMLTPKAMGEIVYLDADGNPIEVLTTVGDGPAAVDVTPSVAVSPDLAPPAPAPSDR